MTRRILAAMLAVTALAVTLFALPLGVAASRMYRSRETARLQQEAARATGVLPAAGLHGPTPIVVPRPPRGVLLGIYDERGRRVAGGGPIVGGHAVAHALRGQPSERRETGDVLVAAVPIHDEELVVGAARAAVPWDDVEARIHRVWLAMVALAFVAVTVAASVSFVVAGRLASPVVALADAVERLGRGDFRVRAIRSGIAELDHAAAALDDAASRLEDVVRRERTFAADASHQLSTPLTGLRLSLEAALLDPAVERDRALADALAATERLHGTVEALLAINRDEPRAHVADIPSLVARRATAWHARLAAVGRSLEVRVEPDLPAARVNADVVDQILEVLVDNAVVHGSGAVTVHAAPSGTGLVVDVEDEGEGIADEVDVFARRAGSGTGHGIGLSLARSLADAEDARLVLQRRAPKPRFVLALRGVALSDL